MSSVNEMVVKTTTLVEKVEQLIATDTVDAITEVAVELGIEDVFNEGVTTLANLLRSLRDQLARLEGAVKQLDAISGIIALIEPLVLALGRMAEEGAEDVAAYGIPAASEVAGEIGEGFGYVESAFTVVQNLTIDADDFHELLDAIGELADEVESKRTDAGASEGQEDAA